MATLQIRQLLLRVVQLSSWISDNQQYMHKPRRCANTAACARAAAAQILECNEEPDVSDLPASPSSEQSSSQWTSSIEVHSSKAVKLKTVMDVEK